MWSTSRQDRCLRSIILAIICIFCITIGYVFLNYIGNEEKLDSGTSVVDIIHAEKLTDEKCIPVCSSKACVLHANTLLRSADFTADPCKNFDSFLCNNHEEKYGFETAASIAMEPKIRMFRKFRGILENIQAKPDSGSGKMKIVYDSCTSLKTSEFKAVADFKKFISELGFSNWPDLQEDFNLSSVRLPAVLGNLTANGAELFFEISPDPDTLDELEQNSFQLFFSIFNFRDSISQAVSRRLLKYFDLDTVHIDSIINDHESVKKSIISFYEELDTCEEDCSDVHHINCSITNESEWRNVCETAEVYLEALNVTDNMKAKLLMLQKSQVDIYKNLFPFLESLNHRSLANFLILDFINMFQEELNFYFRLSKYKKYKILDTDKKSKDIGDVDRWRYCIRWIADKMNTALVNEFFHQYLKPPVVEEIIDIYKDVQSILIDIINEQKWMPLEMKSEMETEMKNILFTVDVLSEVFPNDTFVNLVYEEFHPTSESFFNNVLKLARYEKIFMVYLRKRKWNAMAWTAVKLMKLAINAEYDEFSGVAIHYGMLLPPYFFPGNEREMNRMLMAVRISHEIGHYIHLKFESTLHEYPEIRDTYEERVQCVQDQLSKFKLKILNRNLNGSFYTTESIPDNIATTAVDKICEKYYSTLENVSLPGLPFTAEQLLFMSSYEALCSKANLENEMKHSEGKHVHPPPEIRIIGYIQNSKEFSRAFHCPERNLTDAPKKCLLFDNY